MLACLCAALLAAPAGLTQQRAAEEAARPPRATKLPVRRVVLYKNGVGYFEHLGRVRGSQETSIDFTSNQLNDVLKSLTILDLGGGRITGVSYNSEAPLQQRLNKLRLPLGAETTVAQFLNALRGARLEVRGSAGIITGRLLSTERKTRISGGTTLEVDVVSVVTDAGEVRAIEMSPAVTVRILERDMTQEVDRYLGLLASMRDQDLRRMAISTAGTGDRQLFVSYISEVPVWKTTYRLVFPSKPGAKPLLQGWAIVDNTVGEDWEDVELSLVAGAPQSFIQQLSQPYYSRRPVVPLPEAVALTPQTHQATLIGGYGALRGTVIDSAGAVIPSARVSVLDASGNVVAQATSNERGEYVVDPLPAGNYRVEFESPGFRKLRVQNLTVQPNMANQQNAELQVGEVANTVEVSAEPAEMNTSSAMVSNRGRTLGSGRGLGTGAAFGAPPHPPASPAPGVGWGGGVGGGAFRALTDEARRSAEAAAQARELGDLFEYKLKERVTIRKNQSALVPIIQTEIDAEKVSLWSESLGTGRPLRGVWLVNSSGLTLDGGSFNVLEDETFAGEGITEALKSGEKRLLSYAADLGMTVDTKRESEQQRVTRVRVARGVMIHTREERERKTYTIRNEDTAPRTLVIEHPARPGWKLAEGQRPEETSAGFHRFRVTVPSKQTTTLTVNEARPVEVRYEISDVTDDQLRLFLRSGAINAQVEAALRRVVEQKARVATLESEKESREEQKSRIYDDQQRLRENLKSLKGSAEEKALILRYTRQLDEQENRLATLEQEIADLAKKLEEANAELNKMVQELVLDVNL
jgi:hypothetical protein